LGKDLKGNPLPPGIMQRKSGIYRGRFYYKGETYTKDNADLKKLVQEMEDLRYEVKHGLKGKGDNITLDTWFDIWLNTHKKRTIKESRPIVYDTNYFDFMIREEFGDYDENGHFVINSDHSLEMMIFLLYDRTLKLDAKIDEFASKQLNLKLK